MSKTIDDLRTILFETLEGVKAGTLDLDKARVINDLSKTAIETAKVEVDFLEATGGDKSPFIAPQRPEVLPDGITGVVRHLIQG